MDTATKIVGQLLDVINGDTELGMNGADLALLDAQEIDEHIADLHDKQDILDSYNFVEESSFIISIKNILNSYDTIANDEGLTEEVTLDILEALENENAKCRGITYETSRKAIS